MIDAKGKVFTIELSKGKTAKILAMPIMYTRKGQLVHGGSFKLVDASGKKRKRKFGQISIDLADAANWEYIGSELDGKEQQQVVKFIKGSKPGDDNRPTDDQIANLQRAMYLTFKRNFSEGEGKAVQITYAGKPVIPSADEVDIEKLFAELLNTYSIM